MTSEKFPAEDGWRAVRIDAIWTEEGANGTELVVATRAPGYPTDDPFIVLVRTAGPLYGWQRELGDGEYEYGIEQRTELLHDPKYGSSTVSRLSIIHGSELAAKLLKLRQDCDFEETSE